MVVVAHESYFVPSVTLKGKVSLSQSTSTSWSGLSHAVNFCTSGVHFWQMIPNAEKKRKKYCISWSHKLWVFCIIVFVFRISLSQIHTGFFIFFFLHGKRGTQKYQKPVCRVNLSHVNSVDDCLIKAVPNQKAFATLTTAQIYISFPYRFILFYTIFCDKDYRYERATFRPFSGHFYSRLKNKMQA